MKSTKWWSEKGGISYLLMNLIFTLMFLINNENHVITILVNVLKKQPAK